MIRAMLHLDKERRCDDVGPGLQYGLRSGHATSEQLSDQLIGSEIYASI